MTAESRKRRRSVVQSLRLLRIAMHQSPRVAAAAELSRTLAAMERGPGRHLNLEALHEITDTALAEMEPRQ